LPFFILPSSQAKSGLQCRLWESSLHRLPALSVEQLEWLEPTVELVRPFELESDLPRPCALVQALKTQVLALRALALRVLALRALGFESEPFASRQLGEVQVRVEVGASFGSRFASASCPQSQPMVE
jgi:hypothetical protein